VGNSAVTAFTIGVEEEYLLVDRETLALRPRGERVHDAAEPELGEQVALELNLSQLEVGTAVCKTLAEARDELVRLRTSVISAAAEEDTAVVASGTHPFSEWLGQVTTPKPRYQRLEDDYQQLAREQLICGCHVHVCIPDAEEAIQIMNAVRPWLAVVMALSANSPFWQGVDTGYASYRGQLFGRWPLCGTPEYVTSRAAFDRLVDELVVVGAMPEPSYLYWDVRPSSRYRTLEFRVADVCQTVDEAVMVAALARSLCRTAAVELAQGVTPERHHRELLDAARWTACRYGLEQELIDPHARTRRPAAEMVERLLAHLRADLEAHGEWDEVSDTVAWVLREGNGATRQRRLVTEGHDTRALTRFLVEATQPSSAAA
jgi:carboxylate-amine ligase